MHLYKANSLLKPLSFKNTTFWLSFLSNACNIKLFLVVFFAYESVTCSSHVTVKGGNLFWKPPNYQPFPRICKWGQHLLTEVWVQQSQWSGSTSHGAKEAGMRALWRFCHRGRDGGVSAVHCNLAGKSDFGSFVLSFPLPVRKGTHPLRHL